MATPKRPTPPPAPVRKGGLTASERRNQGGTQPYNQATINAAGKMSGAGRGRAGKGRGGAGNLAAARAQSNAAVRAQNAARSSRPGNVAPSSGPFGGNIKPAMDNAAQARAALKKYGR